MKSLIGTWTKLNGDIYVYLGPYDDLDLTKFTKDEQEHMAEWGGCYAWRQIYDDGEKVNKLLQLTEYKLLPGEVIMTEEEIKNLKIELL